MSDSSGLSSSLHTLTLAELPTPVPLKYHPEFNTPRTDDIIQASDGICFRFKLTTLALFSTFFENLCDMPDHDQEEPIHLPNATSTGLFVVLSTLRHILNGQDIDLSVFPNPVSRLVEVLDVIHVYDMPAVGLMLAQAYALSPSRDSFVAFVLAATNGSEAVASRSAIESLGQRLECMPKWIEKMLEKQAPIYLVRLQRLHYSRSSNDDEKTFLEEMINFRHRPQPRTYTKACCKHGGCETKQQFPDFEDMITSAASTVVKFLLPLTPSVRREKVGSLTKELIKCSACNYQVSTAFDRGLSSCGAYDEVTFQ